MTGLTILAKDGICVTGFTFTFSDGSTQTVGSASDSSSSISFGNANQWATQQISTVASFAVYITDLLQICVTPSTCAEAGNIAGKTLNSAISVGTSSNVITSFYGDIGYWNVHNLNCLTNFNVNYY